MGGRLQIHRLVLPDYGSAAGGMPGGDVTHGDQLTISKVGPWAFQGVDPGDEVLSSLSPTQMAERVSTWSGWGLPSWIPNSTYVHDANPTNYGGIVGPGGLQIGPYTLPAGMWVSRFRDFSAGNLVIEGSSGGASGTPFPGILLLAFRARAGYGAPGFFNQNGGPVGGDIWLMYPDAGGESLAAADYCESIFESKGESSTDRLRVIRPYLTNATTLAFGRNNGDAFIECYGRDVSDFGDHSKHLNGLANSGNQTATLWLRNNVLLPQVAQESSTLATDVFQMAADDGAYPGTGTNLDGSTGYVIKDNYLGGAAYVLQLGVDKANTAADVKNIKVNGNKITTSLYANGGQSGLGYKGPTWGSLGNDWGGTTPNTWADGVNAGNTIPSSAIAAGP